MDTEHEIPKILGVLATHEDGVTPKTLDSHYVKDIMYYFDNPKKTPFNFYNGRHVGSTRILQGLSLDRKRETTMGSNSYIELVC